MGRGESHSEDSMQQETWPCTGGQRKTTIHSRLKDCGPDPKCHKKPLGCEPGGLRIQFTLLENHSGVKQRRLERSKSKVETS